MTRLAARPFGGSNHAYTDLPGRRWHRHRIKHLLRHGDTRLLVDCGLFQGLKNLRELNWRP